jgi:hypothetical protein
MSSFLDEMASKMAAEVETLKFDNDAGRNVFVGELPATPDTCVAFFGLPGDQLTAVRDIPALTFPRYQVLVRSEDYETGADLLTAVRTSLHGMIDYRLPHWRVMRNHAEQEGSPIGEDGQGRFEFTINFVSEYHELPPEE